MCVCVSCVCRGVCVVGGGGHNMVNAMDCMDQISLINIM